MKKYLVVLLALAMVFALATTAMAADTQIADYTDVQPGTTPYASDIYRLTALGVTVGDGLGTNYRPADNLTREEFAKIACFMFGVNDQKAYYAAEKSAFADVAEGKWSEGYINCANAYGLMVGVGGGKFAPTAKVSTAEVAAVVLRAVGYDKNLPGTWPQKYIAKANEAKAMWTTETLGEYVFPIGTNAATRAQVAGIVNYALDMFKVAYVGKDAADADKDGYAYRTADTNEASIYNYYLNPLEALKAGYVTLGTDGFKLTFPANEPVGEKATLLWNVFHSIELPYLFDPWNSEDKEDLAEGQGWGFEDFAKGELVFSDALGISVPVASNYYIYDESLDGYLWQVSGRFADLTIKVDTKNFVAADMLKTKTFMGKGIEAIYADLQSDVEYIDAETEIYLYGADKIAGEKADKVKVGNANVYSLQGDFLNGYIGEVDNYAVYDYDDYSCYGDGWGIVKKNADGKITFDDDVNLADIKYSKNNSAFLNLEKNALVAPETIAKGDVIYKANNWGWYDAALYIVVNPKAGTLSDQLNPTYVTIDGAKELAQCAFAPGEESYLNAGNGYYAYADAYNIYAAEMDGPRNITWAPSYAKKYFAYINDGMFSEVTGVVTKIEMTITPKYIPIIAHGPAIDWADAVAVTILDKTGTETTYAVAEDDYLLLLSEGDLVQLKLKDNGAYYAQPLSKATENAAAPEGKYASTFPVALATPFITGVEVTNKNTGAIETEAFDGVLADDVAIFSVKANDLDADLMKSFIALYQTKDFASVAINDILKAIGSIDELFAGAEVIDRDEFLATKNWHVNYAWAEFDGESSSIKTLYVLDAEESLDQDYMALIAKGDLDYFKKGTDGFISINGDVYEIDADADIEVDPKVDPAKLTGLAIWSIEDNKVAEFILVNSEATAGILDNDADSKFDFDVDGKGDKTYGVYYGKTWADITKNGNVYNYNGAELQLSKSTTVFFNVATGEKIASSDIKDANEIIIITNEKAEMLYVLSIPEPTEEIGTFFIFPTPVMP